MVNYEKINDSNLFKVLKKFGDIKKLKIGLVSTYSPNYTRTETLLALFKRNKIHLEVYLPGKNLLSYIKVLIYIFKNQNKFNILLVTFRGHEILPFIRIIFRKTIIFDVFISIYDTLCFDRKIFKPNSLIGRFLKWYDQFLCRISNFILIDTKIHMEYFIREFNVPKNKISYLYVGCNKKLFKPLKIKKIDNKFVIFWYGYTTQLQGVEIILKAAKILEKEKDICFHLVGPIKKECNNIINILDLKNVKYMEWIPYRDLPKEIAMADLCLGGHFSNVNKAKRVIPGKVFQFIAMEKPIIIGDNPATRELFTNSQKTIFCKMNDEKALAEAILLFKNSQKN